jgi:hypothetical protein
MITTITPLRRVAVTLAMAGVTAFGAVAIAPAAFADEGPTISDQAPVIDPAPVTPEVVVPDATTVPPVVETAPVVPPVAEPAPVPAPVVTPPQVVIGKDGKPVKAPKVCTTKDQSEYAAKLAKATEQAAGITRNANTLRAVSAALRAQAAKMPIASQGRSLALALANLSDYAASKLDAQAADVIAKVGGIGCIVPIVSGGRF